MKITKRGFTLIELLVVIAIIGILSSVVLASLNSARGKGADAAIKENVAGIRAQAELSYDDNSNSYAQVCASSTNALNSAVNTRGAGTTLNTTWATAGAADKATCHATSTAWAAEAPLKTSGYICLDSTGVSTTTSASTLGASDAACN